MFTPDRRWWIDQPHSPGKTGGGGRPDSALHDGDHPGAFLSGWPAAPMAWPRDRPTTPSRSARRSSACWETVRHGWRGLMCSGQAWTPRPQRWAKSPHTPTARSQSWFRDGARPRRRGAPGPLVSRRPGERPAGPVPRHCARFPCTGRRLVREGAPVPAPLTSCPHQCPVQRPRIHLTGTVLLVFKFKRKLLLGTGNPCRNGQYNPLSPVDLVRRRTLPRSPEGKGHV